MVPCRIVERRPGWGPIARPDERGRKSGGALAAMFAIL